MEKSAKRRGRAALAAACACLALSAGCKSVEPDSGLRGPGIPELAGVKSIGVFSFTPVILPNTRALSRADASFYAPVEIPGVNRTVSLLHIAPDAASKFFVNKANLAVLCREVGAAMIGDTAPFDYAVRKGTAVFHLRGRPSAAPGAGPAAAASVVAVTEVMGFREAKEKTMAAVASLYGVEMLLGLEPHVFAEIGRVSAEAAPSGLGEDIPAGQFVMNARVGYAWALFSGATGKKVTDSHAVRPQFDSAAGDEKIIELGTADMKTLNGFISGKQYLSVYEEPMRRGLIPLLPLFRPVYVEAE